MKLRVLSDLHVEFYSSASYLKSKLDKLYGLSDSVINEDEILIIAGDLGVAGSPEYKSMLEYFAKKWKYVILVPGNHEYYERNKTEKLEDIDKMIEKECKKLGIIFLNKDYVIISDSNTKKSYAILGCTLWSEATKEAYKNMNDRLKAILSHEELIKVHTEHKNWLKDTIQKFDKKGIQTIVVTHHLPLMELTHPKYLEPRYKHLNSAYASKLNDIFEDSSNIRFYCCGHTHEKTEKTLYGVDFLINPLGYPRENKRTMFKTDIVEI